MAGLRSSENSPLRCAPRLVVGGLTSRFGASLANASARWPIVGALLARLTSGGGEAMTVLGWFDNCVMAMTATAVASENPVNMAVRGQGEDALRMGSGDGGVVMEGDGSGVSDVPAMAAAQWAIF
ncbi:MAG: hypothetical protein FD130_2182 [Halothiobacillaceae bacterium]|nr:MAG: hypothetical protein FD130_2182 [Halothiobacillaceae bacterium]